MSADTRLVIANAVAAFAEAGLVLLFIYACIIRFAPQRSESPEQARGDESPRRAASADVSETIEPAGLGWHWTVRPDPPVPGVTFKEGWAFRRATAEYDATYAAALMWSELLDARTDQLKATTDKIMAELRLAAEQAEAP